MTKPASQIVPLKKVLLIVPLLLLCLAAIPAESTQPADGKLPVTRSYEGRFQGEPILVEITVARYVEDGNDPAETAQQAADKPEQYLWDIVITQLEIKRRTVDRNGIKMLEIKRSKRGEIVFWGRNLSLSPTQRPAEYVSIGDIGFLVEAEAASDQEVQFEFSTDRDGPSMTVFYYREPIDPKEALKLKE